MKKLFFYAMVICVTFVLSNCGDSKQNKPAESVMSKVEALIDSPKVDKHVANQLVVNFANSVDMNAFMNDTRIQRLKLKLVATCPCSENLILLEAPPEVILNPGGDASDGAKGHGGDGTGVSWNYEFEQDSITKNPTVFVDRYPRPKKTKSEVVVSTIDSGVDFYNTFLAPHLYQNENNSTYCNSERRDGVYGLNMFKGTNPYATNDQDVEPTDGQGHGTFINGIIAGKADLVSVLPANLRFFTGGHKNVNIRQLNISFTPKGSINGTLFNALCGIHYSLSKKAKVINASWGLTTSFNQISEMMVFNPTLRELSTKENDALLVVSAGNKGIDFCNDKALRLTWPAAFSIPQTIPEMVDGQQRKTKLNFSNNVITVGAWNASQNYIPKFSNRSSYGKSCRQIVDIYAPGEDILSIRLGNEPNCMTGRGTSFAAPFITRTAAIIRGLNPTLTAGETKKNILQRNSIAVNPNNGEPTQDPNNYIRLLRLQR